ncbi:Zinc finger C2HC domain-containing protein 1A [Tritrichomonas musculus]|uniref:Zinc finger C2HC domain-containing protein 1A n=1 Tax=Tritrichomonas musculus TaxID=1915356 RepID=A0ABR2ILB4_9EUKA
MDTSNWTVSDVADYLKQIGLGQYSQAFIQNDISGIELPYLNEEYLIELGVKSIGHRIKLTRFIKTIKNIETSFPPLKANIDERDIIHPLPENIYQQLFINSTLDENQKFENEPMKECNVCHRIFNQKVIDYHQNQCQETFNKCKTEFSRRGLNVTNEDIVDLLAGKVPASAIRLEKCKFCGKKISPKLIDIHQRQCQRKLQEKKRKEIIANTESKEKEVQKTDYKEKHNQLIELIKQNKKEGPKYQLPIEDNLEKTELNA